MYVNIKIYIYDIFCITGFKYFILGCPEPMKTNFLRDLLAFFTSKMTTSINGTGPG